MSLTSDASKQLANVFGSRPLHRALRPSPLRCETQCSRPMHIGPRNDRSPASSGAYGASGEGYLHKRGGITSGLLSSSMLIRHDAVYQRLCLASQSPASRRRGPCDRPGYRSLTKRPPRGTGSGPLWGVKSRCSGWRLSDVGEKEPRGDREAGLLQGTASGYCGAKTKCSSGSSTSDEALAPSHESRRNPAWPKAGSPAFSRESVGGRSWVYVDKARGMSMINQNISRLVGQVGLS